MLGSSHEDRQQLEMVCIECGMSFGWPEPPPLGLAGLFRPFPLMNFASHLPALVLDFATIETLAWQRPQSLSNSIWLELSPEADPEQVSRMIAEWYTATYPEKVFTVGSLSVESELQRYAAMRQPGTWAAIILSVLFLLLAGLGLTAQTMLLADSRRTEWALRLALGATHRQLMAQIVVETGVVVGLAAMLSLILMTPFVPYITAAVGYWQGSRWLGATAVTVFLASFVLSSLASAYPLRRVARAEASTVLKESW